jgi:hypothetical protein
MQATKAIKEKAVEIAEKQKLDAIWVNKGGEFFTSENLASLSVKGKKEDFTKVNIGAKATAGTPSTEEETLNPQFSIPN